MQCPRESISSRVRKFSNVPLYAKTRRTTHVGTHAYARMHICTHEFMCTHTGDCVDVMIGKGPGFLWLVVFRSENVKRSNIKSYRDLIIFFFFFFFEFLAHSFYLEYTTTKHHLVQSTRIQPAWISYTASCY